MKELSGEYGGPFVGNEGLGKGQKDSGVERVSGAGRAEEEQAVALGHIFVGGLPDKGHELENETCEAFRSHWGVSLGGALCG